MSRTEMVAVTYFKFEELDNDVQERVVNNWRADSHFHFGDEFESSLNAFAEHFPVKIKNWSVCPFGGGTGINWEFLDSETEELKGVRLFKYLQNNGYAQLGVNYDRCPMTGVCTDYKILEPIHQFLLSPKKNVTFYDLMNDCLESWLIDFRGAIEHWHSEEDIKEEIESNDYEFLADGSLA